MSIKVAEIDGLGNTNCGDTKFGLGTTDDYAAHVGIAKRVWIVPTIKDFQIELARNSSGRIPAVATQSGQRRSSKEF
ncbi:MAG: hypothetical protein ABI557_16430, partial [Aureliella sp.]